MPYVMQATPGSKSRKLLVYPARPRVKLWPKPWQQTACRIGRGVGRPKKFTKEVKTYMDQTIRAHPEYSAKDLKDRLVQRFGGDFETAESSVCKIRKQLGFTPSKDPLAKNCPFS
jgi:transposase